MNPSDPWLNSWQGKLFVAAKKLMNVDSFTHRQVDGGEDEKKKKKKKGISLLSLLNSLKL